MQDSNPPKSETHSTVCVLLNAKSGKKEAGLSADDIETAFAQRGLKAQVVALDPSGDLGATVKRVADEGYGTIIAAGGDGTICGVAQALLGVSCRFGILPRGTFNYFARSLGIPEDLDGAVDVIADGHSQPLRVAMLNEAVFLNNASFGIYPQILRSREEIYDFWGRSRGAAYWSAIKVLLRWPKPMAIEIVTGDGTQSFKTPMIFVFNNAFQLRHMGMEGAECIEDGKLVMMMAHDHGRLGLILSSIAVLLGKASRHRDFRMICAESYEMRVAKSRKLLVARDGERARMSEPFDIRLSETPLDMIIPSEFEAEAR